MGIDLKHMHGDDYLKLAALAAGAYFGGPAIMTALGGGGTAAGLGAAEAAGLGAAADSVGAIGSTALPEYAASSLGSSALGWIGPTAADDAVGGMLGPQQGGGIPWAKLGKGFEAYGKATSALNASGLLGQQQQAPQSPGIHLPGYQQMQIVPQEAQQSAIPFVPDAMEEQRKRRLAMFYGVPYQG